MGTEPRFQPSSVDVAADKEFIFPFLDQRKAKDEQSIPVAPPAHAIDITILHRNASQLSLMIPPALTCLQSKGIIHFHQPLTPPTALRYNELIIDERSED